MSFTPSNPLTGATVTGLTSPTYTLVQDVITAVNAKQYYVSALGGTQTGVTTHSVGSPFVVSFWRPVALQLASFFSALTGWKGKNPTNKYKLICLKGVTPVVGAPVSQLVIRCEIDIPAGAETNDAANVKAALSCAFGAMWNQASGIADSVQVGTT